MLRCHQSLLGATRRFPHGTRAAGAGCLATRKLAVKAAPQDRHHGGSSEDVSGSWFPLLATGAVSVAGLVLLQDPVAAKSPEVQQAVFVWGRREAIPGGAERDVLRPQRVKWFEEQPVSWAKTALGPNFGAALDREGRVYVWGEGRPEEAEDSVFIGPLLAKLTGDARGARFEDVQCSSNSLYLLTRRGNTYVVKDVAAFMKSLASSQASSEGSKSSGSTSRPTTLELPSKAMEGLPQPGWFGGAGIKQMSIGLEHAAFLTSNGEVYCVGGNSWGQCGVQPEKQKGPMGALEEREHTEVPAPVKVKFPEAAGRIVSVSAGGRHTVAQDAAGVTYSFGDDRRIQLGLGDTRSLGNDERHSYGVLNVRDPLPSKPKRAIARSAAYRYYQPHMQWTPTETQPPVAYNRPAYPPASFVACGEDFTLAAHRDSPDWYVKEEETNVLFCCGENGEGQCGRSYQQQQQVWLQVKLPKRSRILSAACGQGHCLALLNTGFLYGWGTNMQGQLGIGSRAPACPPVQIRFEPPPPPPPTPPPEETPPEPEPEAAESSAKAVPEEPKYKVLSYSCGFRNSAVICEVPIDEED